MQRATLNCRRRRRQATLRKRCGQHRRVGVGRRRSTSQPTGHFTLSLLEYRLLLLLLVTYAHWRSLRILVEDDGAEEDCMYIGGGALLVLIVVLLVYFL